MNTKKYLMKMDKVLREFFQLKELKKLIQLNIINRLNLKNEKSF